MANRCGTCTHEKSTHGDMDGWRKVDLLNVRRGLASCCKNHHAADRGIPLDVLPFSEKVSPLHVLHSPKLGHHSYQGLHPHPAAKSQPVCQQDAFTYRSAHKQAALWPSCLHTAHTPFLLKRHPRCDPAQGLLLLLTWALSCQSHSPSQASLWPDASSVSLPFAWAHGSWCHHPP